MESFIATLQTWEFWRIVLIPFVSGFIGWITNAIAVWMIFRPRRPINILGWKVQGLVPKRQPELARSIGHTVEQHLLSPTDIQRFLNDPRILEQVDTVLTEHIRTFLDVRLKTISPMVSMFLSGSMREKLEQLLLDEVRGFIPQVSGKMIGHLEENMNFQQIVEQKVREFDLDRLERIIREISARELKAIELLGGVLGFLIGLIQVLLIKL